MRQLIIKLSVIFFLLTAPISKAAISYFYVDPDASGNNDGGGDGTTPADANDENNWTDAYASVETFNVQRATNLDAANNRYVVYLRSSGGTDDTTTLNFAAGSWTTSATDCIDIFQFDKPANGIFDPNKYVLHSTNSQCVVFHQAVHVNFHNVQMLVTGTGTSVLNAGIYIPNEVATMTITLDGCIIKGNSTTTGEMFGIRINDSSVTAKVYNTVIYNFVQGGDLQHWGIWADQSASFSIYNCTIYNCRYGIDQDAGTTIIKNCAIFGNTGEDIRTAGTYTENSNATDDDRSATDPNWVNISPGATESTDWADAFTNYSSGDFTVKDTGSLLYHNGIDLSSLGLFTKDRLGTTWYASTPSIGAYELYVASPVLETKPQIIIVNTN